MAERRNRSNRRYSESKPWFPFYDRYGALVSVDRRRALGRRDVDKSPWWKSTTTASLIVVSTLFAILSWGISYIWTNQDSIMFEVVADSIYSHNAVKQARPAQ